jgi:hypothetical protein
MLSSKSGSNKIPWKLLSIEAFLIVLSVFLALGLNSWREGRAHQDLAQRVLQTVVDEAMENCHTIQELLPYHRSVFALEREYEGLGEVFIRNDTWPSAQSTGASHHLEYEVAVIIGSIHALQNQHQRLVEAGIRAVYNAASSQDPRLELFEQMIREDRTDWLPGPHPMMLADLIRVQSNLLEEYELLFKLSEEHYGDAIEISGSCLG